jgi:hypothetical protein
MDQKECICCHEVKKLSDFPAQPSKCKECITNQRRDTIEKKAIERSFAKLTVEPKPAVLMMDPNLTVKDLLLERMDRLEAKLDKLTAMVQQLLDKS